MRGRFLARLYDVFADDPAFQTRLAARYAWFGLRWALIVLNIFLPDRRAHPNDDQTEAAWGEIVEQQLRIATNLLDDCISPAAIA